MKAHDLVKIGVMIKTGFFYAPDNLELFINHFKEKLEKLPAEYIKNAKVENRPNVFDEDEVEYRIIYLRTETDEEQTKRLDELEKDSSIFYEFMENSIRSHNINVKNIETVLESHRAAIESIMAELDNKAMVDIKPTGNTH